MSAAAAYVRGMFQWTVKRDGIIAPDERPPAVQSVALGVQHIFAMFGATVLAPILMGFDPNTAIFFSGVGTLIFFVCVRGRVPSYLGSSSVSYTHLRAHETRHDLVCRLLLEKKKKQ